MYKIIYTAKVRGILETYIQNYEDANIQRFSHTWLWCESIIIEPYRKRAIDTFMAIHGHIEKRLTSDLVYGRRPDPENPGQFTLITPIEDRTLIIEYLEDTENLTRTVIELRIFRE